VFRLTRVPDWGVTRMGTGTRVLRGVHVFRMSLDR
jgi:hypothetical protein